MFRRHLLIITIVLVLGINRAQSQDSNKLDSLGALPASLVDKLQLYQTTGEYKSVSVILKESHAFFKHATWTEGSINYRGQVNSNHQIIYDILQDVVFLAHPATKFPVSLSPDFLEWFVIDGHYFEQVEGEEGYFELLYNNQEIALYKKHEKSKLVEEYTENFKYVSDEYYYLKKGDSWTRIRGKGTFTKLFPEYKKEINTYYKKEVRKSQNAGLENTALMLTEFAAKNLIK